LYVTPARMCLWWVGLGVRVGIHASATLCVPRRRGGGKYDLVLFERFRQQDAEGYWRIHIFRQLLRSVEVHCSFLLSTLLLAKRYEDAFARH